MLTKEQINSLELDIDTEDKKEVRNAQAAVEWLEIHTSIDTTDIENLPARAKSFIEQYCEIMGLHSGVASESIGGLSQSFNSGEKNALIWDLATTLLSGDIKSQINFIPAQKQWI